MGPLLTRFLAHARSEMAKVMRGGREPREGLEDRAVMSRAGFRAASRKALKRHPPRNLVAWSQAIRRHARGTSKFGTDFDVGEMEVTRAVYLWVSEPGVREIIIQACTQSGKTTVMESIAGYFMHTDPSPILYVAPILPDAHQFLAEKFMGMVRASPELAPLVKEGPHSGNRIDLKRFPGGRIRAGGTDSRGLFTMVSDRVLLLDEINGYRNAGGDGNPYALAKGRTPEFSHNYFLFGVSSPTVPERAEGLPCITTLFNENDRRLPYVQCPHCGHDHMMDWERGKGSYSLYIPTRGDDPKGTFEPDRATYTCPKGCVITQAERLRMIRPGGIHWRATKPFTCCNVHQDPAKAWDECDQTVEDYERIWQPFGELLGVDNIPPTNGVPSHGLRAVDRAKCSECGSMPVPNAKVSGRYGRYYNPRTDLAFIASEWVNAIRDPSQRMPFYNTIMGLEYRESRSEEISHGDLTRRGESWSTRPKADAEDQLEADRFYFPEEAAGYTIGIDVQLGKADGSGSRFAVEKVAWGPGEESWSLDYTEPQAYTKDVTEWERVLLPIIDEAIPRQSDGREFRPWAVCIDAGNNPDQASEFVARHAANYKARGIHLFAVKGLGVNGRAVYRTWNGKMDKVKAFDRYGDPNIALWGVGNNSAKDTIHNQLNVVEGPGKMHWPSGRGELWHKGILAEDRIIKGGMVVWEHRRSWIANEPLDCRMYALAGLRAMKWFYPRKFDLDRLAVQVGATRSLAAEEHAEDVAEVDAEQHQGEAPVHDPEHVARAGEASVASPQAQPDAPPRPERQPAEPPRRRRRGTTGSIDWTPPTNHWDRP